MIDSHDRALDLSARPTGPPLPAPIQHGVPTTDFTEHIAGTPADQAGHTADNGGAPSAEYTRPRRFSSRWPTT